MTRFNVQRQRMIDWKKLLWKWLIPIAVASLCGGLLWSWAGCVTPPSQTSQAQQQGNVSGDMTWSQQFVQQGQFDRETLGGIACLVVFGISVAGVHFKGAHTIRAHLIGAAIEGAILAAAMILFGVL